MWSRLVGCLLLIVHLFQGAPGMKGHRGHVGQHGVAVSRVKNNDMMILLFD